MIAVIVGALSKAKAVESVADVVLRKGGLEELNKGKVSRELV